MPKNVADVKPVRATGVEGQLIYTGSDYYFRVYDHENNTFVDYNVWHSDLTIKIQDPDAYFYTVNGRTVLDHSPETLGYSSE